MNLKVTCLDCKEEYLYETYTTKIHGPIIETECPKCNTKVIKNLSSFLSDQTANLDGKRIHKAIKMIDIARSLHKQFNPEKKFKKKKKNR